MSEESFRLRQNGQRLRVGVDEQPRALVKAPALPERLRQPENGQTLGFDRGFMSLVVVADAEGRQAARVANPRFVRKGEAKLARLSQALSRTKKGSKRWQKTRQRVNKHHDHVAAQKRHSLHHLANELVDTQARLVGEDLSLQGMAQKYGKSVQESALGELMRMLDYKLEWRDREIARASRWYPSTRRCSDCTRIGPRLDESVRWFQCEACGYTADRDLNAARRPNGRD